MRSQEVAIAPGDGHHWAGNTRQFRFRRFDLKRAVGTVSD